MPDGPAEAGLPAPGASHLSVACGAGAWAVVVAGGSGSRFGGYKQFMMLAGREVVDWSLEAARRACAGVVLVVPR